MSIHPLRTLYLAACCALALIACGDDSSDPDAQESSQRGDASTDSADAAGADAAVEDAACDRQCLIDFNTDYLEALVARDGQRLPLADSVKFTENGVELSLSEGLWAVAASLRDYRQDFAEVSAGQTAGFVVLDDDRGAVLLAFRLRVVQDEITEIETLVARAGDASFFSPEALMKDPDLEANVDQDDRLSRERLVEITDLYFQGLVSGDGSIVPFDANASRNENGFVTATGETISELSFFTYIDEIKPRYALVDRERGITLPFVRFEIPSGFGGARTLQLAELFKIEGGKIMKIQAIMVNTPLGTPSGWE